MPDPVAIPDRPSPAAGRTGKAILLACAAVLAFVIMNTLVKSLARDWPMPEIIWGRYFFHFLLVLLLVPRRIPTLLRSRRKGLQVLRSILVLLATLCMFNAVRLMPLADVIAITFTAPLIVTGLSVVMLGEKVGPRRWGAVAVGFLGMLVIVRPGAGVFEWFVLLALGQAFFYALYQILTRLTREDADPLNAVFYTALVGTLITSAALPFWWQPLTPLAWLMLAGAGAFGGLGHYALIRAFATVEVSILAPWAYTEIIWATLFGLVFFGDLPDLWTFAGAGIIAGSGLYILHRERALRAGAG